MQNPVAGFQGTNSMKDKFFIDTNIFIYSFDATNPEKQSTAQDLISDALFKLNGCISYQVIQEFLNVATRKFSVPLSTVDCQKYLTSVLDPLCEIFPSTDLSQYALEIFEGWHYSFYDSLIISAALKADCNFLYTEDMQHGQIIQGLSIKNPFLQT